MEQNRGEPLQQWDEIGGSPLTSRGARGLLALAPVFPGEKGTAAWFNDSLEINNMIGSASRTKDVDEMKAAPNLCQ